MRVHFDLFFQKGKFPMGNPVFMRYPQESLENTRGTPNCPLRWSETKIFLKAKRFHVIRFLESLSGLDQIANQIDR